MPAGHQGRGLRSNQRVLAANMDRIEPLLGQRPAKTVGLMCLKPLLSTSHVNPAASATSAPGTKGLPTARLDAAPPPRRRSRFLARRVDENLQEPWVQKAADRELFGCLPTAVESIESASSSTTGRRRFPSLGRKKATESTKSAIASNASSLALATSVYTAPVVKEAQAAAGRSPRSTRHNIPSSTRPAPAPAATPCQVAAPPPTRGNGGLASENSDHAGDELRFVRVLMYSGALHLHLHLADAAPVSPQQPRSKCALRPPAASAVVQPARPRRPDVLRSEEISLKEKGAQSAAASSGDCRDQDGGKAVSPEKGQQRQHRGRRSSSIATVAEDEDELATHVTRGLLETALHGHAIPSRACTPIVASAPDTLAADVPQGHALVSAESRPDELTHPGGALLEATQPNPDRMRPLEEVLLETDAASVQERETFELVHKEELQGPAQQAEAERLTPEQQEQKLEESEEAQKEHQEDLGVELPVTAPAESLPCWQEAEADDAHDDDSAQLAPPGAAVEETVAEPEKTRVVEVPPAEPELGIAEIEDELERQSSGDISFGPCADTHIPPLLAVVSTTASPASTPTSKAQEKMVRFSEVVTIEDAAPPTTPVTSLPCEPSHPPSAEDDSEEANCCDLAAPFSALTAMRASGADIEEDEVSDSEKADYVPRRRLVRKSIDAGTHDDVRAEAAAEFVLHGAFNKEVEVNDTKSIEAVGACVMDTRVEVRLAAIKALSNAAASGDVVAIEAIGVGLRDPGPLVQRASIRALEQATAAGSSAALDVACSHLSHKEARVRAAAARSLSKSVELGQLGAIEALISQLDHADAVVRAAAIDMLRSSFETGHTEALPNVCRSLQDSDARVRYLALNALSIAWERGLPISAGMINLSPEETNAYVRRSAEELLLRVRRRAPEEESRQRLSWMPKKQPTL
mmetsp:Transcript_8296/g.19520  ORF Transcript_8296/g.19520 Transcript_8296/m.19520 type:complete len:923 (-) Transcript_8296:83-2851(-)